MHEESEMSYYRPHMVDIQNQCYHLTRRLIFKQRTCSWYTMHTNKRTYTSTTCQHFVAVDGTCSESDLTNKPLSIFGLVYQQTEKWYGGIDHTEHYCVASPLLCNTEILPIESKSARVVIQDGDLVGSYNTEVQRHDVEIAWYDTVQYPSEPGCTHTIELTPLFTHRIFYCAFLLLLATCTCFKLWCQNKAITPPGVYV